MNLLNTHQPIILNRSQDSLAGCLLVAASKFDDDYFSKSVIYIVAHNQQGAMGMIVNRLARNVTLDQLLDQVHFDGYMGDRSLPIISGGPVDEHRGFIVHNGEYLKETSISNNDGISVTANAMALTGWLKGEFTAKAMLVLGYAGWAAGQLESEIESRCWITIPATSLIMFDTPIEERWNVAISSLGFEMGNLSSFVGHA